ncbi:SCO2322 family protein [Streptomyces harbinensis]|uniref:SCO2322 family protein n=1 Tax=Streptomyces harbinensis TaxID=1176198 RepID=UPI003711444B
MRRALALLGAVLLLCVPATQAWAASYTYWSFWQLDAESGAWGYATQGPGTARVSGGDVVGFHFTTSESATAPPQAPRGTTEHAGICPDAPDGVAVVIDFGTADGAPAARTVCAAGAAGSTAAAALAEVAEPLRYGSDGLLCGISDYPATGCGEPVAAAEEEDEAADDGASFLPTIATLSAVALLAVAALWHNRRRRRDDASGAA